VTARQSIRFFAHGRPYFWLTWLVLSSVVACNGGPQHPLVPNKARPNAPSNVAQVELRRIDERPRVALLSREGDPVAAVVVAVAAKSDDASQQMAALAALLKARLAQKTMTVQAHADAMSLRLHFAPSAPAALADFFSALSAAMVAKVEPAEPSLKAVGERLMELRHQRLDSPALAPIARCSGELHQSATTELSGGDHRTLERARAHALTVDRIAIGVVGTAPYTKAALEALEATPAWPGPSKEQPDSTQTAVPSWPDADGFGAFLSALLPQATAELQVGWWLAKPYQAVSATQRMGAPWSALTARLAALDHPWRLEALSATARASGGCVRLRLRPIAQLPVDKTIASAAQAVAELRRELQLQVADRSDPFAVTTQITGASTAADAAARAAWWSLVTDAPADRKPSMTAVLGLGAVLRDPSPPSDTELDAVFREAVAEEAGAVQPAVRRWRVAVERGQGKLWLLLANPCALDNEGIWNAGSAALAVASAQLDGSDPNISVRPWVSPEGVGLIASGWAASADEDPHLLARRVGAAVGRAASQPITERRFARAQGALLTKLRGADQPLFETLARSTLPDHPSWLLPLGEVSRQTSLDYLDARARLRELMRGPLRIAVLANVDSKQGQVAAQQVERWLRRRDTPSCDPGAVITTLPHNGAHRAATGSAPTTTRLLAVVPKPSALSHQLTNLTATALEGGGLLAAALASLGTASTTIRVLGGRRHPVLTIRLSAAADKIDEALQRTRQLLKTLHHKGLAKNIQERAFRLWSKERTDRRAQPSQRLIALWLDEELQQQPPPADLWKKWLNDNLTPARTVVVANNKTATP